MGARSSQSAEGLRIVLFEFGRLSLESFDSPRVGWRIKANVRLAEHVPLDQIDHGGNEGRRTDSRGTVQANPIETIRRRLPRVHFSLDQKRGHSGGLFGCRCS